MSIGTQCTAQISLKNKKNKINGDDKTDSDDEVRNIKASNLRNNRVTG